MYNLVCIIFVEGYTTCIWAVYEFKLNWEVSASKTKQSIRILEFKTEASFNIYAWKPSNKPEITPPSPQILQKQSKTFQYINIAQFSFENMSFSFTFLRTAEHTHSPTIQYLLVIHTGTNSFYTNAIITFNEHAL